MVKRVCLPASIKKRLISTLMDSHSSTSNHGQGFELKSTTAFASRSDTIFRELQILEKNHETWVSQNETLQCFEERCPVEPIQTPRDVFKKPFAPKSLKRKANSFPHGDKGSKKWTKYSLADVPLSSDATNSAVALQFLDELRKRKERVCEDFVPSESADKILFRRPKKVPKSSTNTEYSSFKTHTNIGIVGGKTEYKVEKSAAGATAESAVYNVKLTHLQNDFNE